MSLWSKIRGTIETIFQLGLGGPQLKSFGGRIEARDSADAAFVIMRAATPVGGADVVIKTYCDAGDIPFFATYNVDPGYAGGNSNGSPAKPYTTFAAAFAAALAAGVTSGIIVFAGANSAENIVFPVAGGNWEIKTNTQWGEVIASLSGTIDLSGNAQCRRALTNLQLTGVITGNAPNTAACRAVFSNCQINNTVTLTVTAGGAWRAAFVGLYPGAVAQSPHRTAAAVVVAGNISASTYRFASTVSFSDTSDFTNSELNAGLTSTGAGAVAATLVGCTATSAPVLTASSGSLNVTFDKETAASFARQGCTISGTVNQYVDQPTTARQTLAGNLAAVNVSGPQYPKSMMTVRMTMTLLVAGTAGSIQAAIGYTDLNGTLQSVNIGGPLLVTAALGTEVTGTLTFSQNGSTPVTIKTTGVVTPGALSYSLAFDEQISA
jgi:hypothetical protein